MINLINRRKTMINRLFGWLFTIIALAAVVFAALNWGNYSSMCFDKGDDTLLPTINEIEEPVEELPIVDSLVLDTPVTEQEAVELQPTL